MNFFDKLFKRKQAPAEVQPTPTPAPAVKEPKVKKSAKDIATENGEPYIAILSMDVDPSNINQGAFELDWNDKFIANLVRAGYQGKTDADLVDQWFQNVCRNVVLETWEQDQAIQNSSRFTHSRDIGDGRREHS